MNLWVVEILTAVVGTMATGPEPVPAPRSSSPPVIAVVSRSESDPVMVEALNRFRGEAAAVGFAVTLVPVPIGVSPAAEMKIAGQVTTAVATVAFVHGDDPAGLDVWFMDRQDGQTVVDHVTAEPDFDDRALIVAVKAVDVLRARLFGLLARRRVPPATAMLRQPGIAGPAPPMNGPASPTEAPLPLGISLGLGALRSVQGLGTSLLLMVRGAYDLTSRSALRITFGGLGTRPTVEGERVGGVPVARAMVRQTLLMMEWTFSPWLRRVRPILVAGGGAQYFSVEGTATGGFSARTVDRLVGAAEVSVGAHALLSRRIAICLEAGAMLLFPPIQVSVAGANASRTGRPTLVATVTMEARL